MTSKKKILIVEDNNNVRKTLHAWLSLAFPNTDILQTDNGEDAVTLSMEQNPDIVLMDIGLPGINGLEAMQQIKSRAPETSVVIISIHETQEYQADAAASGALAFVPKHKMYTDLTPILRNALAIRAEQKDKLA